MTKPNLKLATIGAEAPPPRSPQRIALVAAVERNTAAQRQIAAIKAAQAATDAAVREAREVVEKAAPAIEEAKANAAQHLTDTMLGTAGAPPLSVKDARAKVQDAEDSLEAALATRAALEAQKTAADSELQDAKSALYWRVRDVVQTEADVGRLLADFDVAHRTMVMQRLVLQFLDLQGAIPKEQRFFASEHSWPDLPDVVAPWANAVAALETDASAPLPI